MPIYEYRCGACDRVSTVFVRSVRSELRATCDDCGSTRMKRLMSRLSRVKSDQQVMDDLGMPAAGGSIEDPRQIGRWVEQRFQDYGMDVPEETRQMIDAARDGELPDPVSDL
ncbi:MAG: zinc ribbon domain-containing protein [Chloroflexi bacterium]|nr:zinc ribbon domain-containing protein [Chloroflexota bacterium]MDA1146233.1 zinc ribbon domain-containing protein [Chloroflexota bacterium]